MSAVRIVMVLWGGLLLVVAPTVSARDGDLWWLGWLGNRILETHRLPNALGHETFTATGAPWVPQEWFLGLLIALANLHGLMTLLSLALAAAAIAVLWSIVVRARSEASPTAIAIVLILAGMALSASFGIRAQVLGWACFSAFLVCLQRDDRYYYLAFPAVIVWANVHASAALAPAFLVLRIAGAIAQGGLRELASNRDVRLLPLVVAALFCTPLAWHLPLYSLTLATSPIRQYIQEWQPSNLGDVEFTAGALPLAALIAMGGLRFASKRRAELLPVLVLFAAAILAKRNVPLFAIAAAPIAAAGLTLRIRGLDSAEERIRGLERPALVAICAAIALTAVAFAAETRHQRPSALQAALSAMNQTGVEHRLFCENFNTCSFALQYPHIRVFMDGRCDPYPLDVWKRYIAAVRVEADWQETMDLDRVDSALTVPGSRLARAFSASPGWRAAEANSSFVLYVRT